MFSFNRCVYSRITSFSFLLPSVLWHCWLGHLTRKNPSTIWPVMCLVGHYQSINKFISRHSTEALATVRLCRIKDKCLETDLKCVNGWSSSTVQWKSPKVSEQQQRNDEQQCLSCAAELTEAWLNLALSIYLSIISLFFNHLRRFFS